MSSSSCRRRDGPTCSFKAITGYEASKSYVGLMYGATTTKLVEELNRAMAEQGVERPTLFRRRTLPQSSQNWLSAPGILTWAALTPGTLNFPAQRLGTSSAAQVVTLTNHQPADTLEIDDIAVTGDFKAVATGNQPCGSRLAALSSCKIGVVFAPPAGKGNLKGALTVAYNASPSPAVVNLTASATGTLPRFAYSAKGAYSIPSETGLLIPSDNNT